MFLPGKRKILNNSDMILKSIENFKKTADSLITRLCTKLKFPKENVSEDWRLSINEKDLLDEKLDEVWEYYFHGYQCKFENKKTGQIVNVQLKNYENLESKIRYYNCFMEGSEKEKHWSTPIDKYLPAIESHKINTNIYNMIPSRCRKTSYLLVQWGLAKQRLADR